jgi:aryl-alcohol dehydrogenase-like predicted oxidoreductase
MQKRQLGRSGISVAPLCLGGNVFGWTADEATSFTLLDRFIAAGFDFVDTADTYSSWVPGHTGGESESVIGRWLAARGGRDRVVIATKVGMWEKHKGLKSANIIAACEGSLRRLQTDYVDLYQAHRDDTETPLQEALEAFGRLINSGKVRAIGASNYDAERLELALGVSADMGFPRYDVLQPLYNLVDRDFESALQPICVAKNIGVIPYYSLAAGFLTGKYRNSSDLEGRARGRSVSRYINAENIRLLELLDRVAKERNASMAEVAIAWLRDRPAVVAPIASATSQQQLESLLRGATLALSAEETALLDRAP